MPLKWRWIPAVAAMTAAIVAGCTVPPFASLRPASASDDFDAPPIALHFLGEQRLAHRLEFGATIVGGLSGIDYEPATDTY